MGLWDWVRLDLPYSWRMRRHRARGVMDRRVEGRAKEGRATIYSVSRGDMDYICRQNFRAPIITQLYRRV